MDGLQQDRYDEFKDEAARSLHCWVRCCSHVIPSSFRIYIFSCRSAADRSSPLALLASDTAALTCTFTPLTHIVTLLIFDSGMGAGKGHTLRYLLRKGIVRLPHNFIWYVVELLQHLLRNSHTDPASWIA